MMSNCTIVQNGPMDCILFQGFSVGQMKGTLVHVNSPLTPKLRTFLHLKLGMMSNQPNKLTYGLHTI